MIHLEDKEQMAVIEWAGWQPLHNASISKIGDYLIAIPNAGKRSAKHGKREKLMGLKPGVSDLFLAVPRNGKHGLWIEMKKRRESFRGMAEAASAVIPTQRQWLDRMERVDYATAVAYGSAEAIEMIKVYLDGGQD